MSKRYRGINRVGGVAPVNEPGYLVQVVMRPAEVHAFMDLIEGYSHLTFPAVVNPKAGLVLLHTTPDCYPDVLAVIASFPLAISILPATE